jgi:hypothetical protein
MKDLNKGSAPRYDSINYVIICQIYDKYLSLLTSIYNDLASTSNHPEVWKKVICIVIPKYGKKRYDDLHHTNPYPYSHV